MKLSGTAKKMIAVICAALVLIIIAGVVFYRSSEAFPFALGAFLGAALNALKIIMMERSVDRIVNMEAKNAGNFASIQYLLRFALTAALLVVAALTPFINLWGVAAGILTMPVSAFSMKYFGGNE